MLATQPTAAPIPYLVQLSGVHEVSLIGTADLDYWQERLRQEDLYPIDVGGEAQIQICVCEGSFLGVRFREFSVSVRVSRRQNDPTEGAFLVRAYNSIRFFAFVERTLYRTPYYHAGIYVSARAPAYLDLASPDGIFCAAMLPGDGQHHRRPARGEPDGWEGAIYLPRRSTKPGAVGEVFYGKLAGQTLVYPFDEDCDFVKLVPSARGGVLRQLSDSRFRVKEWHVRQDATHAKSRTVSRPSS